MSGLVIARAPRPHSADNPRHFSAVDLFSPKNGCPHVVTELVGVEGSGLHDISPGAFFYVAGGKLSFRCVDSGPSIKLNTGDMCYIPFGYNYGFLAYSDATLISISIGDEIAQLLPPQLSAFVVKKMGEDLPHHVKDFLQGTVSARSARLILPGVDFCPLKVTRFIGRQSFLYPAICYDCDEFVLVLEGSLTIYFGGERYQLQAGDMYYVPAGCHYGLLADTDVKAICVFMPSKDGVLPDDD